METDTKPTNRLLVPISPSRPMVMECPCGDRFPPHQFHWKCCTNDHTLLQRDSPVIGTGASASVISGMAGTKSVAYKIIDIPYVERDGIATKETIALLDRFAKEAALATLMGDLNIGPPVIEYFYSRHDMRGVISMERGDLSLADYLNEHGNIHNMSWVARELVSLFRKMVHGGTVCLDLKPSNVIVYFDDIYKIHKVQFIDFGAGLCDNEDIIIHAETLKIKGRATTIQEKDESLVYLMALVFQINSNSIFGNQFGGTLDLIPMLHNGIYSVDQEMGKNVYKLAASMACLDAPLKIILQYGDVGNIGTFPLMMALQNATREGISAILPTRQ